MAGLTTAHCLCSLFDEVVLLERDVIDTAGAAPQSLSEMQEQVTGRKRPGVPQYGQPHVLLKRGIGILNRMFGDGFEQQFLEAGAQRINWMLDVGYYNYGIQSSWDYVPGPKGTDIGDGICASRALYERVVRREVVARNGNLTVLNGTAAAGLTFAEGNKAVTGLQLSDGSTIAADLVVDASGRNSGTPGWLKAAGYEEPPTVSVAAGLGYASGIYKLPADQQMASICDIVIGKAPDNRSGIFWRIEDDTCQIHLVGYNQDYPPTDEEGFLAYARTLATPTIANILAVAERVTPIMGFRRTDNFRRFYDKIEMPEGLVVLGDAACVFNPVHGQGMTVGMVGAETLSDTLAKRLEQQQTVGQRRRALLGLSKEFQPKLTQSQELSWTMAVGEDARRMGKKPEGVNPVQAVIVEYFEYLRMIAQTNTRVMIPLWQVYQQIAEPAVILSPVLALFALRFWLQQKTAALWQAVGKVFGRQNAQQLVEGQR